MSPAKSSPRLVPPVGAQDHRLGAPGARVTLVEYGDFQCPHCREANAILRRVRDALGPKLRFVYRHFPMSTLHPLAKWAAVAAEAAAQEGRFWAMHDLLFARQDDLESLHPQTLARLVGLDPEVFLRRMQNEELYRKVEQDFYHGVKSGVNATPTFYINGLRYDAPWDRATLLAALRAELGPAWRRAAGRTAVRKRPVRRPAGRRSRPARGPKKPARLRRRLGKTTRPPRRPSRPAGGRASR